MDIYAKLKEILATQFGRKKIDVDSITPETRLSDLDFDSLDTAELIVNIEEAFSLPQFTQEEMMEVKTVKDLKELIEKKR